MVTIATVAAVVHFPNQERAHKYPKMLLRVASASSLTLTTDRFSIYSSYECVNIF